MQGVENEFMKWCLAVHVDVLSMRVHKCVWQREREELDVQTESIYNPWRNLFLIQYIPNS